MYKLISIVTLLLLCCSAHASGVDKYAQALGWQEKWQRVVDKPTDDYVDRIRRSKLSQLPEEKQTYIAEKLKQRLKQRFDWESVGREFTQSFVDSCGTNLLDKIVNFYAGVSFSADEKRKISGDYKTCASSAAKNSMARVYSSIDQLLETESADNRYAITIGGLLITRKQAFKSFREKYLASKGHKAFAQSASGNWNWRSNRTSRDHAINSALASCRARNQAFEKTQPCITINVNGEWTDIYRRTLEQEKEGEAVLISKKALKSYRDKFVNVKNDKAFAQSTNGSWSWRSSKTSKDDAIEKALTSCHKSNKKHEQAFPCQIVNVNDNWLNN